LAKLQPWYLENGGNSQRLGSSVGLAKRQSSVARNFDIGGDVGAERPVRNADSTALPGVK
jgi:hypothetical protein